METIKTFFNELAEAGVNKTKDIGRWIAGTGIKALADIAEDATIKVAGDGTGFLGSVARLIDNVGDWGSKLAGKTPDGAPKFKMA